MSKKVELEKEDLKKVSGGVIVPSDTWFQCNDCGARWFTNRPDRCHQCIDCKSTNIKRI